MNFKVGDKVKFNGIDGEVVAIINDKDYPIIALFEDDFISFTSDGRYNILNREPKLIKIDLDKKINKILKL